MSTTRDFKRGVPKAPRTGGIRFSARRVQQTIEKSVPAFRENFGEAKGVYANRGRGANGESSN